MEGGSGEGALLIAVIGGGGGISNVELCCVYEQSSLPLWLPCAVTQGGVILPCADHTFQIYFSYRNIRYELIIGLKLNY